MISTGHYCAAARFFHRCLDRLGIRRHHRFPDVGGLRAALERFVKLPPSANERREKLEQLRALDAGMRIDIAVVKSVPLGVDTPEDLEKARKLLAG